VRAFCEKDEEFKDFMLHRFVSIPEIDSDRLEMANPERDKEWFKTVEMVLIQNPALDPQRQRLVADDYAMGPDQQLPVSVRAPLVKYMVVELRIGTPEQAADNPNAHQLVLANRDELGRLIL
jgi:predicted DNA-binding transcriptional regulator YafY